MSKKNHAIILNGEIRETLGKGASRRLRKQGFIPTIVYGDNKDAKSISLLKNELNKALSNDSIFSQIIPVTIGKNTEMVIIKALHRHPFKKEILHVDLQRVNKTTEVKVHVALNFIGEDVAPGVKLNGGVVHKLFSDVEIACTSDKILDQIDVDISKMDIGDVIHLSELVLPQGVTLTALAHGNDKEHDQAVVLISSSKSAAQEEETTAVGPTVAPATTKKENK
tara:strand:+ start:7242 stop:7913 length:672 start_codon:yes stop_codon:yes gene_type:complete